MSENISPEARQAGLTVIAYTAWTIAAGVVRPRGIARISDVFNNWDETFIPLEDGRLVDPATGQVESQSRGTLLLPRQEILLVHEVSAADEPSQRAGVEDMRVQKQTLLVRVGLGPYAVQGSLYLPQFSTLANYLNHSEQTFLPLTSALISLTAGERLREVRVPFVLVCRGCLLIHEAQLGGTVG